MAIDKKTSAQKNTSKKKALGRGLGALLEDSSESNEERTKTTEEGIKVNSLHEIPLDNIETNPFQPRSNFDEETLYELAESIKTQGLIQPITVRMISENSFQLISGERRVQASKIAGLEAVPAYIRVANDQQMLEMALIENIQRENLNAIEIALSYQRLITECQLRQEQLGERVGKNRTTVNNYLRLLKLPPDIQAALRDGRLTMGHARALITMDNADHQLHIFHKTIKDDLSVRKVEELARNYAAGISEKGQNENEKEQEKKSPEIQQLQSKLSSHFGTKVQVKSNQKNKGEIKIPFVSTEDLNRILELMSM